MKPKSSINMNVIEPLNWDELDTRYTEAVFKIIRRKVSTQNIEELIEKLKPQTNFSTEEGRRDEHESSNL